MREAFEEQYMAVPEERANGKKVRIRYQYIGTWYVFGSDDKERRTGKLWVLNAVVSSLILYIAAGIQNSPLNYDRYVQLFGLLSLAPFVFELVGAGQFCLSGERVTDSTFWEIRRRLTIAPILHAVLLVLACAVGIHAAVAEKLSFSDYLIPLCYFLAGLLSAMVSWKIGRFSYHKEKQYV
jgi:hypothetical protein